MNYSSQIIEEMRVPKEALGIRRMMEFLVKDEKDYEELNAAIIENHHLFFALASMRKNRLGKLTLDQFRNLYLQDKKNALEQLFQEQIANRHIKMIDDKKTTLEQIYSKHKEMPNVSFLQIIAKEL